MKQTIAVLILLLGSITVFSQNPRLEPPDSTKLTVKMYQFNDFKSIDTIGIDTLQRHIELFNAYEDDLLPAINLGQIATPSLHILFSRRNEFEDFMFLNPYIEYVLKPDNLAYYKTNNPYTDIRYLGAMKQKEQQNLSFIHTQTINNNNFGIKYEMFTAKNLATDNENASINKLNFWYHKKIKRYDVFASFYSTKIKRPENGGISNLHDTSYNPFDETQNYLLNNPRNLIEYRGLYLNQSFVIHEKLKVRHILNYSRISRTFYELTPNSVLGTPLISPTETYDSTGISSFDNTAYLFSKLKNVELGVSFTNKLRRMYYFRGYLYDLSGQFYLDNYLSFYASKFKISIFNADVIANYHLTNRKAGDFNIRSNQFIEIGKSDSSIIVSFEEKIERSRAGYFYEHFNGNYDYWNQDLRKINNLSLSGKVLFNKYHFELGGNYNIYSNYIYFDTTAMPVQADKNIYISTVWAKKSFYFGPFASDINLFWQKSNYQEIVNVPEYVATVSLYADFHVFKKAANINVGFNVSYMSQFYMYGYTPTTGILYLKNKEVTGNYPILNLFFTAKIKSAIIILRFDHANDYLLTPYYSTVENYNLSSYYFRFGVRWWFRN